LDQDEEEGRYLGQDEEEGGDEVEGEEGDEVRKGEEGDEGGGLGELY